MDEGVVEVLAEPLRYFRNGQCRKLTAQAAHFRVESVPLIAACDECFTGFGVERLRAGPGPEPGQAVRFREELMRIGDLRECWGAQNKRENNTDVADHVKTAERHDSLPGSQGRRRSSTTGLPTGASHKVVITIQR